MENENNGRGRQGGEVPLDLGIENEILRLRLSAELGGVYEVTTELPLEVENHFLKSILAFEQKFAGAARIRVFDLIGRPPFVPVTGLDDAGIMVELARLKGILLENDIVLEFIRPRADRFQYEFLTGEFFQHETDDIRMEGMTKHFSYEEFHPDHEIEIRQRTGEFLHAWFARSLKGCGWVLADEFLEMDGNILNREHMLKKIGEVFESYVRFYDCSFSIRDIRFALTEDDNGVHGLGHSEGEVGYSVMLENGECRRMEGPFKLYFCREQDWWTLFFFYLKGFNS